MCAPLGGPAAKGFAGSAAPPLGVAGAAGAPAGGAGGQARGGGGGGGGRGGGDEGDDDGDECGAHGPPPHTGRAPRSLPGGETSALGRAGGQLAAVVSRSG